MVVNILSGAFLHCIIIPEKRTEFLGFTEQVCIPLLRSCFSTWLISWSRHLAVGCCWYSHLGGFGFPTEVLLNEVLSSVFLSLPSQLSELEDTGYKPQILSDVRDISNSCLSESLIIMELASRRRCSCPSD